MNIHESVYDAVLDFEIDDRESKMIAAISSFILGYQIKYFELHVIHIEFEYSCRKYTVKVNSTGETVEFKLNYRR